MLPRTILLKRKAFRQLIVFMLCLAKACLEYTSLKGLAALLSKWRHHHDAAFCFLASCAFYQEGAL